MASIFKQYKVVTAEVNERVVRIHEWMAALLHLTDVSKLHSHLVPTSEGTFLGSIKSVAESSLISKYEVKIGVYGSSLPLRFKIHPISSSFAVSPQ